MGYFLTIVKLVHAQWLQSHRAGPTNPCRNPPFLTYVCVFWLVAAKFAEDCQIVGVCLSMFAIHMTLAGLEPAIFGSKDQRLIH